MRVMRVMRVPRVLALGLSLACAAALVLVAPRAAHACSASCNAPAFFVPGDGATVPANLPGLFWRPRADADPQAVSPANVTLASTADPGTPLPFTATQLANQHDYLLVPDAPLVVGASYVLADSTPCWFGGGGGAANATVTFTVGAAAPLPAALALAVTELPPRPGPIASGNGSCSMEAVLASTAVAIDYEVAADAAPWRDMLHFETFVDGRPWIARRDLLQLVAPGASWEGRGFDRIYTVCSTDDSFGTPLVQATPGGHQVQMRATLPGTDVALATGTATIDLDCGAAADVDGGLDEGGAAPDAGCCSSSTHPGAAAGLALFVALALMRPARPARRRRGR